jgi:hypothetical protein
MCPTYRCPVDETVFDTNQVHKMPTQQGHPECPGPACSEKFKDWAGPQKAYVRPVRVAPEVVAPPAPGPVLTGHDWTPQPPAAAAAETVAQAGPIPSGQGW